MKEYTKKHQLNLNEILKNVQIAHRRAVKTKQRNKKPGKKQKTKNEMADLTLNKSIITLIINVLNIPIKCQKLAE